MSHMFESWHMRMRHVTRMNGMSHGNETCHIRMCHVTRMNVNETCHIRIRRCTYDSGMSHVNESRHMWTSHVARKGLVWRVHKSCCSWVSRVTCEYIIPHVNKSRLVTHDSWLMTHDSWLTANVSGSCMSVLCGDITQPLPGKWRV